MGHGLSQSATKALWQKIIFSILIMVFFPSQARGGTSACSPMGWGGRAVGMGGVGVAIAEDAASMVYNPAGLTQIEKRFDLGMGILRPWRIFSNKYTPRESSVLHLYQVPQSGYVQTLEGSPLSVGGGMFFTYGAGTDYQFKSPFFRQIKNAKSVLGVLRFIPAAAYKVNEELSLGVALNINYGLIQFRTPFGPAFLDMDKAEGWGVGFSVGLLYKPTDKLSLGLCYTSESNLKDLFSDKAYLSISPWIPLPRRPEWEYDRAVVIDLQEPAKLAWGIAWRPREKLLLAFDFKWQLYSQTMKKLEVKLCEGNGPNQHMLIPLDWDDLYGFALGGEYRLTQRIILRAGYEYDTNITPASHLLPIVPTVEKTHMVTFGIGYKEDRWGVDLGWAQHFQDGDHTKTTHFPTAPEYNNSTLEYGCNYWVLTISRFF